MKTPVLPDYINHFIQNLCAHEFQTVSNITQDPESKDYKGFRLELDGVKIVFRAAKITPKKEGLFVTLRKRVSPGTPTVPFDYADIDFAIIYAEKGPQKGYFIFESLLLVRQNILIKDQNSGKLGFRVYTPWCVPTSKQASKTREWQIKCFVYAQNTSENIQKMKSFLKIM